MPECADARRKLQGYRGGVLVELALMHDTEIAALNASYLCCAGPTNILSFPASPEDAGLGVLALGLEHSRQATAAQAAVTNMTNDLLKKNAEMLKMGTIETAKEAERSIVDIETLQHTNQQLISTLDEVMQIQKDGAQKRREAELELGRIEGELKQKLLELRG